MDPSNDAHGHGKRVGADPCIYGVFSDVSRHRDRASPQIIATAHTGEPRRGRLRGNFPTGPQPSPFIPRVVLTLDRRVRFRAAPEADRGTPSRPLKAAVCGVVDTALPRRFVCLAAAHG
jgi:hypothetical protein